MSDQSFRLGVLIS